MAWRRRLLILILIMTIVSMVITATTIFILYSVAFEQSRERLVAIARSQARLIEAVARFDAARGQPDYPGGPTEATLSQIADAHEHYKGIGRTGEFTLARRVGDHIVYLLRHRHEGGRTARQIPFGAERAGPMRRALSGLSGTMIGLDYRGAKVLAAYEPVAELDLGIVAKIDLLEIREPYVRAGIVAVGWSLFVLLLGVVLFLRVINPLVTRLEESVEERTAELRIANEALLAEIEERKATVRTLRRVRDSLAEAQRIAHIGNWDWDVTNNRLYWSDEIYRIFGLKPREFGATYEAFLGSVHPDSRADVQEAVDRALNEKAPYSIDHRIVLPDGSERMVHEQAEVTFDENGKPSRMMGTVQDITEQKEVEQELRASQNELRHLSAQLLEAQERERKRVARELHDGLGQTLNAMKFRIENTIGALGAERQTETARALKNLVSMAQEAVEEVRIISKNLWPSILDDLGLLPTISWFCREFGEMHPGIRIQKEMDVDEQSVPVSLKIVIYRVLQEAMNNVARHSRASELSVSLKQEEVYLQLEVRDNGVGFLPEQLTSREGPDRGLGLASMKERTELSKGSFSLESRPGSGTRILASWECAKAGEVQLEAEKSSAT
jgi:PAS domain S-box-containing protein